MLHKTLNFSLLSNKLKVSLIKIFVKFSEIKKFWKFVFCVTSKTFWTNFLCLCMSWIRKRNFPPQLFLHPQYTWVFCCGKFHFPPFFSTTNNRFLCCFNFVFAQFSWETNSWLGLFPGKLHSDCSSRSSALGGDSKKQHHLKNWEKTDWNELTERDRIGKINIKGERGENFLRKFN